MRAILFLAVLGIAGQCWPLAPTNWARANEADSDGQTLSLFQRLDRNGDGQLTRDEIPAEKLTLFERLVRLGDGNSDGKLSTDEFAVGLGGGEKQSPAKRPKSPSRPEAKPGRPGKAERPGPGRLFTQWDANSDGRITPDEVPVQQRPRFERLLARADQNQDGGLNRREFLAVAPVQPASMVRSTPQRAPADVFRRLDANGDGNLVTDEVPEARRPFIAGLIRRADADGNGGLSVEEFTGALEQVRAMRPEANEPPTTDKKPPKSKKNKNKPKQAN